MTENLISAPITSSRRIYGKYEPYPANPDLAYDAICKTLSARQALVNWDRFGVDEWRLFAQMAEAEGVGPLLYWKIGRTEDGGQGTELPPTVQQSLRASYYQTAAQNTVLFQELERILTAFTEAGIPVIVLKGAALAQTVYADSGLRPMGDLDLLIRPGDLGAAGRALQTLGYIQEKVTYHAYLRGGPEGQVTVELHWSQVLDGQGHSPDIEWLWAETEPYIQQGENQYIKRLRPVAQFVYLTGHLMLQTDPSQRRLIWFYDLYQLYKQHLANADWERLLNAETTACWSAWMQAALYQLRDLFGIQLPPALAASPAQPPRQPNTRTITRNFIRSALAQLDRKTRFQVTTSLLFPSKNYLFWRYGIQHKWLWPLYLPRRWWEIGQYLLQAR